MNLFEKCMETVKSCLTDAKMDKISVDDVVLVGGSSRIPKVQQLLQDFFNRKDLCKSINPDEAVAYGAAVQAAVMCEGFENVPKLVLMDVTPLSLGISVKGDLMDVVIPRNTPIPFMKTEEYATAKDNQSLVSIDVYEGERSRDSDNNLLGMFNLPVPPAPRGFPIKVCFAIDAEGILKVSAWEETRGTKRDITITNENGRLSREEIERMILDAENFRSEDIKFKKKAKAINDLDDYLYNVRKVMKDNGVSSVLSPLDRMKITSSITKGKYLLDGGQREETHYVFVDFLKELQSIFESTLKKVNNGLFDEESDSDCD